MRAGELVDDDDLAATDDVVGVPAENDVGAQSLVEVVDDLGVLEVVQVLALEHAGGLEGALALLGAVLGQDHRLLLLVDLVVGGDQLLNDRVDLHVQLGLVVGRAGDDQRGPRLVDQHRVDLVDDGEIEGPLDHLLARVLHVVAQVVEAVLVVGAVGDVGGISGAAGVVVDVGDDDADGHAEEFIDPAHPLGIARREVIVDGDDVDAVAAERVQIDRERRDQGLALAGAHLGNLAAVEDDAADQLDVIVALAKRALGGLTNRREGLRQQRVEGLAGGDARLELGGLGRKLLVGQRYDLRFEAVDLCDQGRQRLDVAVV